ncbi:class I SAM-dependent methyltransferase [Chakrabartyella piscis]|uniref:class I SAM-dependent methyltransferase n=1 Tax=Chakrabartyella piscis TaxID=2918914 RepID=UPI002958583D|nr:class I SAM-dependent methyltransferase [Chakrabartyella piscis]
MNEMILDGVQDTLLIPMMARTHISNTFPEYFYDAKALEIADKLPPNQIVEKSSEYEMIASASRCVLMDDYTRKFIKNHEQSNIVCIGCGLETMAWRLLEHKKHTHFYEIDFPSVITLRKEILGVCENETLISGDVNVLDLTEYMDTSLPTLFVVAGVFMYFKEPEVLSLIGKLQGEFENAEMLFDAVNDFGLKFANRYVEKTGNKGAKMYFCVKTGGDFAKRSNTKLIKQGILFGKVSKKLKHKLRWKTKLYMFVNDWKETSMLVHIKL